MSVARGLEEYYCRNENVVRDFAAETEADAPRRGAKLTLAFWSSEELG